MLLQDFGDHSDSYYSVQTTEGEQISQLIAGYIDIILKKVRRFQHCILFNICYQPLFLSQEFETMLKISTKYQFPKKNVSVIA